MAARHQVRLYGTDGQLQAVFDSWRELSVHLKINTFSEHTIKIDKKIDNRWQLFKKDCFVEFLRSEPTYGIPWRREYIGFHRTPQHSLTEEGNEIFTSYGRSLEDLLRRRTVLYAKGATSTGASSGYHYTDKSGTADDVMKAYVYDNLGAGAASVARGRQAQMPNFTIANNTSVGPQWSGEGDKKTILSLLTDIANASGVDFEVQLISFNPVTFLFITHYPLRGVDRTLSNPPLILSPDRQNVKSIDHTDSATEEVTTIIGYGVVTQFVPNTFNPSRRITAITSSGAVVDSPWNDIELVEDFRTLTTLAQLQDAITAKFAAVGSQESFQVTPLQSQGLQYGRDYSFGDRVFVNYNDFTSPKKVVGVQFSSSDNSNGEAISIEFGDYAPLNATNAVGAIIDAIRTLSQRLTVLSNEGNV